MSKSIIVEDVLKKHIDWEDTPDKSGVKAAIKEIVERILEEELYSRTYQIF